jgi:acyl carrier protein
VKEYEAPQGEIEEILAGIWQELLQVARAGRRDNFFDLGGHSLLAVQIVARVREVFQVDIPLVTIFYAATIATFAEKVLAIRLSQFEAADIERLTSEINELSEDELEKLIAQEP